MPGILIFELPLNFLSWPRSKSATRFPLTQLLAMPYFTRSNFGVLQANEMLGFTADGLGLGTQCLACREIRDSEVPMSKKKSLTEDRTTRATVRPRAPWERRS